MLVDRFSLSTNRLTLMASSSCIPAIRAWGRDQRTSSIVIAWRFRLRNRLNQLEKRKVIHSGAINTRKENQKFQVQNTFLKIQYREPMETHWWVMSGEAGKAKSLVSE